MKQLMINYQTLFSCSDTIAVNEYASCQIIRSQSQVVPICSSAHMLLFVLQGEATLYAQLSSVVVRSGNFIAVCKASFRKMICSENTILLEYTPVKLICTYIESCNRGFNIPYSSVVRILPSVDRWIEKTLCSNTEVFDHEAADIALTEILVNYPEHYMGELYVPFYAYHMRMGNLKQ